LTETTSRFGELFFVFDNFRLMDKMARRWISWLNVRGEVARFDITDKVG
jgi:hypothetical protein